MVSPSTLSDDTGTTTATPTRLSSPKRTHAEAFTPASRESTRDRDRDQQPSLQPISPTGHRLSHPSRRGSAERDRDRDRERERERERDDDSNGYEAPRKPAKMRSSIACARCRRSKVKCVNNGAGTPCNTCEAQGRDCEYPPSALIGLASRREAGVKVEQTEGVKRPRHKKDVDGNMRVSSMRGKWIHSVQGDLEWKMYVRDGQVYCSFRSRHLVLEELSFHMVVCFAAYSAHTLVWRCLLKR